MSDELTPAQLRALADRMEQEATTAREQAEAERLQQAIRAGNEELADSLVDRMLERLGSRLEVEYEETIAEAPGEEEGRAEDEDTEEDPEPDNVLEGRWRPVKVFGAKLYSGPQEPDTVRFRNEKGQLQSRPGRVPGRPYQTEWEQVEDEADEATEEDAA